MDGNELRPTLSVLAQEAPLLVALLGLRRALAAPAASLVRQSLLSVVVPALPIALFVVPVGTVPLGLPSTLLVPPPAPLVVEALLVPALPFVGAVTPRLLLVERLLAGLSPVAGLPMPSTLSTL